MPKSGAELNMSEELFKAMIEPAKESMLKAKAKRDDGIKVKMPDWNKKLFEFY